MRVRKVTLGGLKGYSGVKWMSRKKTPPSYGEPGGPRMVDTHSYRLSPLGPALPTHSYTAHSNIRLHISSVAFCMLNVMNQIPAIWRWV